MVTGTNQVWRDLQYSLPEFSVGLIPAIASQHWPGTKSTLNVFWLLHISHINSYLGR